MIIALTGYMATGKTAVGKVLADLTGFDFVDLDDFIEAFTGISSAAIIRKYGERSLRVWENKALSELLMERDDLVLALGGGTITEAFNLHLLKNYALLVFLDTPFTKIIARLKEVRGDRPMLIMKNGKLDERAVEAHYRKRLPLYEQAHVRFINEENDPSEAAKRLLEQLKKQSYV